MISKIADRAAKTDVLPTRAAHCVLGMIDIHRIAVIITIIRESGTTILAIRRG
jgi:hypothetical protein